MFKTAGEVCTGNEERHESRRLALKIACANGHTKSSKRNPKLSTEFSCIQTELLSAIPPCLAYVQGFFPALQKGLIGKVYFKDAYLPDTVLLHSSTGTCPIRVPPVPALKLYLRREKTFKYRDDLEDVPGDFLSSQSSSFSNKGAETLPIE
ncbi:hypothetical protein RB195_000617 [Necator americanus]|uniref:Uncharacterized protein n=1 Tax=Necator americanus TaxID=51031 RepID=A0ABR1DB53_NECAM